MESKDLIANKKKIKNQKNANARSEHKLSKEENDSFERLRNLYLKTEEMKEISRTKKPEIESEFKHLRERLNNSSGFLSQIKQSIENIKFSYEREIMDLEKVTEENRNDIDKQIQEIREHIHNLQSKVPEKKNEASSKPQTYQEAITDVLNTFQNIAQGKYHSQNKN